MSSSVSFGNINPVGGLRDALKRIATVEMERGGYDRVVIL